MTDQPLNDVPETAAEGRPSLSAKDKLAAAQLPERTVHVCLRADLVDEFEALEAQLVEVQAKARRDPRLNGDGEAREIAGQMEALREQMRDSSIAVKLRALTRKKWDLLGKKHPPRKDVEDDQVSGYNMDTFGDAAIRACWVEPADFEAADITELLDERVTAAQYAQLWNAVLTLNIRKVDVPFSSRASAALRETLPG